MESKAWIIFRFALTNPFPVPVHVVFSESLANNLVLGMIRDSQEDAVFYYSKECPIVQ